VPATIDAPLLFAQLLGKVGSRHLDCINNVLHGIVPTDLELRAANVYHGLYNQQDLILL
jgi:hypothetical protein